MTVAQCAAQMLEVEEEKGQGVCGKGALAVGIARVGAKDQEIVAGTLQQLSHADLGAPLHSLVLLGRRTHDVEWQFVREYAIDRDVFDAVWKEQYENK